MLDLIRQESQLQQSLAYNYDQVDAAHRPAVIAAALEIKPRVKRASEDLLVIGQQLNAVKSMLPHGEWGNWLNAEFSLSDRSAQNFMNIAERFAGKSATVALLSSSVLGLLAAPSTPAEAVAEVVETATASGHSPTKAEATEVIAKHKPPPATWAPIWRVQNGVRAWVRSYCGAPNDTPADWLRFLAIAKDEKPDGSTRGYLCRSLDQSITAETGEKYRWSDVVQACGNLIDQFRQQVIAARPSEAPAPPARPFNFIAATPRALTKEETLAVVARGLAAARPTGSNADQIAWLAASQLADFTPLLTARVFIDPTYLAQAKRQLEADLKSRSKTSEPVGEPVEPTVPADLVARGWGIKRSADKWWGHNRTASRATAMFEQPDQAIAAMRAMQIDTVVTDSPLQERAKAQALLSLYQTAKNGLADYTQVTGHEPEAARSALKFMVEQLEAFLSNNAGSPTL